MGVREKLSFSGSIIGPPQLSEYAVDPEGVATISPSPQNILRNLPLISASTVIMEVVSWRVITTSFSA